MEDYHLQWVNHEMGDAFHSELLSYQRVSPLFVGYLSLYGQETHMSAIFLLYLHSPIIIFRSKWYSLDPHDISLYPTNQWWFHDDFPCIPHPYFHLIFPACFHYITSLAPIFMPGWPWCRCTGDLSHLGHGRIWTPRAVGHGVGLGGAKAPGGWMISTENPSKMVGIHLWSMSNSCYNWWFPARHGGTPIAGRFIREHPIQVDDSGVPIFQETSISWW